MNLNQHLIEEYKKIKEESLLEMISKRSDYKIIKKQESNIINNYLLEQYELIKLEEALSDFFDEDGMILESREQEFDLLIESLLLENKFDDIIQTLKNKRDTLKDKLASLVGKTGAAYTKAREKINAGIEKISIKIKDVIKRRDDGGTQDGTTAEDGGTAEGGSAAGGTAEGGSAAGGTAEGGSAAGGKTNQEELDKLEEEIKAIKNKMELNKSVSAHQIDASMEIISTYTDGNEYAESYVKKIRATNKVKFYNKIASMNLPDSVLKEVKAKLDNIKIGNDEKKPKELNSPEGREAEQRIQRASQLTAERDELKNKIVDKQNQYDELKAKENRTPEEDAQLEQLQSEITDLKRQKKDKNKELFKLADPRSVEDIDTELNKLIGEDGSINKKRQELDAAKNETPPDQEKISKLKKQLMDLELTKEDLEDEKEYVQSNPPRLQIAQQTTRQKAKDVKDIENKIEDKEKQLDEEDAKEPKDEESIRRLNNEITDLKRQKTDAINTLREEVYDEYIDKRRQMSEKEARKNELTQKTDKTQEEEDELARINQLNSEINSLRDEVGNLPRRSKHDLDQLITDVKEEITRKQADLDDAKTQTPPDQDTISKLEIELNKLKYKNDDLNAEKNIFNEQLQTEIENITNKITRTQADIDSNETPENRKAALRKTLDRLKAAKNSLDNEEKYT